MYNDYGQFINGGWRQGSSGETIVVTDPGRDEQLGEIVAASREDTLEAIASAEAALAQWQARAAWERADTLHRVAAEMELAREQAARTISLESGKPLAQASREWTLAIDQFTWYAEEARRVYGRIVESRVPGGRCEVSHQAVGVVAAFTAWNFPVVLIARKLAPALAAGCTVVLRPSSEVPGSAMVIMTCLQKAGLPAGVVNMVVGPTANTYQPLIESPVVRKVTLTGSTAIGQQMIRDSAATLKRVSMELGGNAPMIVFEDADIEKALDLAVPTKFANCGQVCVTADRFYVHESVAQAFIDGFARRAAAIRVGYGLDEGSEMGPLINLRRLKAIEGIVEDARQKGARVITGGQRIADKPGFWFAPTVLADVPDDALALAEENFGPIAAITTFTDEAEVIARVNRSELALSAYAFTRDAARIRRVSQQLQAGMVGINSFALASADVPFGGIKASGMGSEGGAEGIYEYMNVKLTQVVL
ncbi:NAD-dependent succinate-semialdehyde dehydrogenase [Erwinia sp. JUb26]|uniref:NAD-dependent succinate-semialdehyde dehydrogenase n=1 Tax=Erwinia sp. JUb26 TaxID=2485126 RepID=UPI000F49226A|nr:NAD-dependent succinate-semialdehyde dehydrogenase [Erwinia sp. JUb26]ROR15221.1 succinate-semialdehyde dehydrogenase/glutarate-semialdehyde dehydrogenase [Erwinia sp. JUb26]